MKFIITVFRKPGTNKPQVQRYNFDDIGAANAAMPGNFRDPSVNRVELTVVLKEMVRVERDEWRIA